MNVPKTISVGSQNIFTNNYNTLAQGYTLNNTAYGNDETLHYTYDSNNNLNSITYNSESTPRYKYFYDSDGNIASVIDNKNNIQTSYSTNSDGSAKVTQAGISTNNNYLHSYYTGKISYCSKYNTRFFNEFINNIGNYITNILTDKDGRANGANYALANGTTTSNEIAYDDLGRISGVNLYKKNAAGTATTNLLTSSYSYTSLPQYKTSNQVYAISLMNNSGYNKVLSYQYDKLGNIINDSGKTYVYDEAGELTRVNDPANGTIVYAYDIGGNISSKTTYAYTTGTLGSPISTVNYGYDATWKDKLTNYNGNNITYDAIGNPLSYYNGYTFSWEMGRQLAGITGNSKTISYQYDDSGIRTQKIVSGTTTRFTLADGKITYQTDGTNSMYFRYNGDNTLIGFELNGTDYYYVKNLQGGIISILDNTGADVVDYTYDAWGKLLTTTGSSAGTVGVLNPFRYRSYYYDTETELYYLNSRYYNPEIGRFINADDTSILTASQGELLSHNLFAYCRNNPVMKVDPWGYGSIIITLSVSFLQFLVGLGVGAIVSVIVYTIIYFLPPMSFFTGLLWTLVSGVVSGIIGYIAGGILIKSPKTIINWSACWFPWEIVYTL